MASPLTRANFARLMPTVGSAGVQAHVPAGRPVSLPRLHLSPAGLQRTGSPNRLKLYRRPGPIAVLDDHADFGEMLAAAMPDDLRVKTFLSPQRCVNELQQETAMWEADYWAQQQIVELWCSGSPLIPLLLEYWRSFPERRNLTKVCIVEYNMPGKDGLQTLGDLLGWPGKRILLTGTNDDTLALRAFNAGLIDRFVAKQTPNLARAVVDAIRGALAVPNERYHQIWSATLTLDQQETLSRPDVAADLDAYLEGRFSEWVIMGEPFGILALDAANVPFWIQLELSAALPGLAELALASGVASEDAWQIREGRKLARLHQALGMRQVELVPALQVGKGGLLAGVSMIPMSHPLEAETDGAWRGRCTSDNQSNF